LDWEGFLFDVGYYLRVQLRNSDGFLKFGSMGTRVNLAISYGFFLEMFYNVQVKSLPVTRF
jgi:hypothetical protein